MKESRSLGELMIGKRFRLLEPHPHAGESGEVVRVEKTNVGWGLVLKLDSCKHGVDECFVFGPEFIAMERRTPQAGVQ